MGKLQAITDGTEIGSLVIEEIDSGVQGIDSSLYTFKVGQGGIRELETISGGGVDTKGQLVAGSVITTDL